MLSVRPANVGTMSTEITVRGSFSAFRAPERGTVHASVSYHGPEKDWVYDQVARDLDVVKHSIQRLEDGDSGAVASWSTAQLRTWSHRPRDPVGDELPLAHVAKVGVEVEFRDLTALSRWVGEHVTNTEGFEISYVDWSLTTDSRDDLVRGVRTGAVQDAAARAQLYADAVGLGTVAPVAIADAGMLGGHTQSDGGMRNVMAEGAPISGSPEVELVPRDIRVSATVDARFVAAAS